MRPLEYLILYQDIELYSFGETIADYTTKTLTIIDSYTALSLQDMLRGGARSELKIPMRYIDFGRLLSTLGSVSLPLIPEIETWLADNGIACRVTNPWKLFLTS